MEEPYVVHGRGYCASVATLDDAHGVVARRRGGTIYVRLDVVSTQAYDWLRFIMADSDDPKLDLDPEEDR